MSTITEALRSGFTNLHKRGMPSAGIDSMLTLKARGDSAPCFILAVVEICFVYQKPCWRIVNQLKQCQTSRMQVLLQ